MTHEHDRPTAPDLQVDLDRLTADEVELLAGIVDAIGHGQHPVVIGPQRKVLERVGLKLQAHKPKEGA